jgi:hypothetical protein
MFMQAVHLAILSPLKTSGKVSKASKLNQTTVPRQEGAHDGLRSEPHPLDAIFAVS